MQQQRVIGLIGGMSWESSAEYYRIINREVQNRLGGVHSARILLWSLDFGEVEHLQHRGEWDKLAEQMKDAAIRLEQGGADFVLMCTNTMHRMADAVAEAVNIPLLGAEAIVLCCTEIMLLVSAEDSAVPPFDTTTIHAIAAVDHTLVTT